MSEAAQTDQTQGNSPPSTPPAGEARTLYGAGLKFGEADPVEDWAKGKTAQEVYELARSFRQATVTTPVNQINQAPQQAPFQSQEPRLPDPNLIYSNAAEYQRQMHEYNQNLIATTLQTYAAPILQNNASGARFQSQLDPEYKDVWSKYGPEIDQMMMNAPAHMKTKEAYDAVAQVVRGKHYKELADELANQKLSQRGTGTESTAPNGAVSVSGSDPLGDLFNDDSVQWSREAKQNGLTLRDVRHHVENVLKIPPQQFVDDIKRSRSFSARAV